MIAYYIFDCLIVHNLNSSGKGRIFNILMLQMLFKAITSSRHKSTIVTNQSPPVFHTLFNVVLLAYP